MDLSISLPIERIRPRWLEDSFIELYVLRLDKTDVFVSGNKWFKLAKNIEHAKRLGHYQLLTFGGAYSNHLLSFAHACKREGMEGVAVVRGEELSETSNPMLTRIHELGCKLLFVDRVQYRNKYEAEQLASFQRTVGDFLMIPEGGSNEQGVLGAEAIARSISNSSVTFDDVFVACGTGATFAGMIRGCGDYEINTRLTGLSVFRPNSVEKEGWLSRAVSEFIKIGRQGDGSILSYELVADAQLPGYGKLSDFLLTFCDDFLKDTGVLLDPVYTAKLFYYLKNRSSKCNDVSSVQPKKWLAVHTGGLHGWLGHLDSEAAGGKLPAQLSGTIKHRLYS